MTAAILLVWVASGVLAARASSVDGEWRHWAPVSVFFGPLWLTVTAEQRQHDALDPNHRL